MQLPLTTPMETMSHDLSPRLVFLLSASTRSGRIGQVGIRDAAGWLEIGWRPQWPVKFTYEAHRRLSANASEAEKAQLDCRKTPEDRQKTTSAPRLVAASSHRPALRCCVFLRSR